MDNEVVKIVEFCKNNLKLINAKLSEEYFYNSLPLCVIDSVFSIGVNYVSTKNVVERYCKFFNLDMIRKVKSKLPSKKEQQSVTDFCEKFEEYGIIFFTNSIFKNKQRTSTKNGILKSQAVYEFCKVLKKYNVNYFQDVKKIISSKKFEIDIKKIKGQSSGISLKYFFMLTGSDDFIKPDRMVLRFLKNILNRNISLEEAHNLLKETTKELKTEYTNLNPRLLDHQIWIFQREN